MSAVVLTPLVFMAGFFRFCNKLDDLLERRGERQGKDCVGKKRESSPLKALLKGGSERKGRTHL